MRRQHRSDLTRSGRWFKVDAAGLLKSGTWPDHTLGYWATGRACRLFADVDARRDVRSQCVVGGRARLTSADSTWTFRLPPAIKPGRYLIRAELVALCVLWSTVSSQPRLVPNRPQFYPQCLDLLIGGDGADVPSDAELVSFPGAYAVKDPRLWLDIHSVVPTTCAWPDQAHPLIARYDPYERRHMSHTDVLSAGPPVTSICKDKCAVDSKLFEAAPSTGDTPSSLPAIVSALPTPSVVLFTSSAASASPSKAPTRVFTLSAGVAASTRCSAATLLLALLLPRSWARLADRSD